MTWLFIWNPTRYAWDENEIGYNTLREEIALNGKTWGKWTCGSTKRIHAGDRVFLMRLGVADKGIVASGHAATDVFEGLHWDPALAAEGRTVRRIYIEYDRITDMDAGKMLPIAALKALAPDYTWTPMSSGVSIPDAVAEKLEAAWAEMGD